MKTLISALPLLLVLGCPLMMIFMMRGMHGGAGHDDQPHSRGHEPTSAHDAARDERIAELEREVAALREQRDSLDAAGRS